MIKLHSPAKINLFLHISHRRTDGYHELNSLFQTIDFCDIIYFNFSDQDRLTCSSKEILCDESNLIFKSLKLFRKKTGFLDAVSIHLDKNIPVQAGLGGGSGNAATTLWALNELFNRPASTNELMEWSAEIGSDVPFFFSQGIAFCSGRGEQVKLVPFLPNQELWIVKPNEGLSTPKVYSCLDVSQILRRDTEILLKQFSEGKGNYFNDLEKPAFQIMPKLEKLKQQLSESGFTVLLCGSGSSLFCVGNGVLPSFPEDVLVKKAKFISRSPSGWYIPS